MVEVRKLRGDSLVFMLECLERLRDGRARNAYDFEDIREVYGLHRKTVVRTLEALARVRCLAIEVTKQNYRRNYRLMTLPTFPKQRSKYCHKCTKSSPLPDGFYVDRSSKDGFTSWCRRCCKLRDAQWPVKNRKRKRLLVRRAYKVRMQDRALERGLKD